MELAELQARHEDDQTDYLAKEQQLNDARGRLRELERAAQEAEFAEKSQRSKIDELKRSIATAQEQAAQLFANMQRATELESLDDQTAQTGLQDVLDKRSEQEAGAGRCAPRTRPADRRSCASTTKAACRPSAACSRSATASSNCS